MDAWKALSGEDAASMRVRTASFRKLASQKHSAGRVRGLLFGRPVRFMNDLVMQLEMKPAYQDYLWTSHNGGNVKSAPVNFVAAAGMWCKQHGYENRWDLPGM